MRCVGSTAILVLALSAAGSEIVLRNGQVVDAPIETVAYDGVSIGGDAPRMLGWDLVYYAEGEGASDVAVYAEFSDTVWRAKSRLERGDFRLAGPLFEELFEQQARVGIEGPTGLMIAEGTLRCRVASGRHTDAIEAWAVALDIRGTGQRQSGESAVAGLIDAETGLVPTLAPIWLDGSVDAKRLAAGGADAPGTAGPLIALYRASARRSVGGPEDELPRGEPGEHGERLVALMLRATGPDELARVTARERLLDVAEESAGSWQESWARTAIGRSLLMESEERLRDAGVLHLLHLPARFSRSQPHLAAVALAEVGREMHERGDSRLVELMRSELRRQYPEHEANAWLDAVTGN
jgi:hypothetical protein